MSSTWLDYPGTSTSSVLGSSKSNHYLKSVSSEQLHADLQGELTIETSAHRSIRYALFIFFTCVTYVFIDSKLLYNARPLF